MIPCNGDFDRNRKYIVQDARYLSTGTESGIFKWIILVQRYRIHC